MCFDMYHIFIPYHFFLGGGGFFKCNGPSIIVCMYFLKINVEMQEREFLVVHHLFFFFLFQNEIELNSLLVAHISSIPRPSFFPNKSLMGVFPKSISQNIFLSILLHSSFPSLLPYLASLQFSLLLLLILP